MSVRRALVDCAVLSVQDTCVFYPSCKSCFSRINVQQAATARCRCSKCGYNCLKEQVEYRYRLSLRVTRNSHIFGVTVFGSCLNPLFGTPASSLQRLVQEDSHGLLGAHNQTTLLANAVEDCFVGRHFVFGLKVADSDWADSPLFSDHRPHQLGASKEESHFIASQITLSCAAAPGCSVISYYRSLLQQAAVSADLSAALRLPPSPFSFHATPPSCLRSLSQLQDDTLTPTSPWQQSLGVVTSSAEQDEDHRSQGNGGGRTGGRGRGTPRRVPARRNVGEEERAGDRTSVPSSPCGPAGSSGDGNSFWNLLPSFSDSPESPVRNPVKHTPATHTWPAPPEPGRRGNLPSSPRVGGGSDGVEEDSKSLSGSVAWEDMPFSESLGEFVCAAAGASDGSCERTASLTRRNVAERNSISSRANTLSTDTLSDRTLLDITNLAQVSYRDVNRSDGQTCRGLDQTGGVFPSRDFCPPEWEGGDVSIRKCKEDKEERLGSCDAEDGYNCSADLFNCSQISANAQMPDTDSQPQGRPDAQDPSDSEASALDPAECSHSLDFVPFSQSTPMAKRTAPVEVASFRASSHTHTPRTHKNTHRLATVTHGHRHTPSSHSNTPKAHSRKQEPRQYVLAKHRLKLQKKTLKVAAKCPRRESLGVCDTSLAVCESDTEIPPTCKVRHSVRLQQRRNSGCERVLQHRATSHQQRQSSLAPKQRGNDEAIMGCGDLGYSEKTSAREAGLSPSVNQSLHDDSGACDWSRDLFADSF